MTFCLMIHSSSASFVSSVVFISSARMKVSAMPSGSDIREMFLRYFEQQKHKRVHSSSLVPEQKGTITLDDVLERYVPKANQDVEVSLGPSRVNLNFGGISWVALSA